jgi:hypothetical protein
MPYVMVLLCVQLFEMRSGCCLVAIGRIVDHHCFKLSFSNITAVNFLLEEKG